MNCDVPRIPFEHGLPDLPPGVPPLTMFYVYLSESCNLACRHCWITPNRHDGERIQLECIDFNVLKKAVQEAKPLGLCALKLTGGEPLLHPDIFAIIDLAATEKLGIVVETNGTLVTHEFATYLKDRIPAAFISVSLDGSEPVLNDALRGVRGAFKEAVTGFKHLVSAGFKPQVIMSVYKGNVKDIDTLVRLAVSLGAGSVKFNPINLCGRALDMNARGELLTFDEVMTIKKTILGDLQDRSEIPLFMMIPPAMLSVGELLRRYWDCGRCHILNILGILGSGHMALCGIGRNIPELCFGRLGEDSVREIWLNHPVLVSLRTRLGEGEFPGICGNCIHSRQCLMHCLAQNYIDSGKLVHPSAFCIDASEKGAFPVSRMRISEPD